MYYSDNVVERIRDTAIMSEIVSQYVRLKATHNQSFSGLCPFHNEKTPSFSVNNNKKIFKCFGCGVGGDVFTFIQTIENISYPEAIQHLAKIYNIPLPKNNSREYNEFERLYNIHEKITSFFIEELFMNKEALYYVQNIRKLSPDTISTFSIGYSSNMPKLLNFAKKNNITPENLIDAGILKYSKYFEKNPKISGNKKYYYMFENRIMFPVFNNANKIIAFGGRVFRADDPRAKYINSPETKIFKKNKELFGLRLAKKYILQNENSHFILTEGYMDVISLYNSGVYGSIAGLGTAYNASQMKQIWQYDTSPILCFDNDNAGQNATLRLIDIILPALDNNKTCLIGELRGGKDPDEIIKNSGKVSFENIILNAKPLSHFLWQRISSNVVNNSPESIGLLRNKANDIVSKILSPQCQRDYKYFFSNSIFALSRNFSSYSSNRSLAPSHLTYTINTAEYFEDNEIDLLLCFILYLRELYSEEYMEYIAGENWHSKLGSAMQKTFLDIFDNFFFDKDLKNDLFVLYDASSENILENTIHINSYPNQMLINMLLSELRNNFDSKAIGFLERKVTLWIKTSIHQIYRSIYEKYYINKEASMNQDPLYLSLENVISRVLSRIVHNRRMIYIRLYLNDIPSHMIEYDHKLRSEIDDFNIKYITN